MHAPKNDGMGKQMNDNMRTYYNFIREHNVIGRTPAEETGINLNLGRNKWLGLVTQAL